MNFSIKIQNGIRQSRGMIIQTILTSYLRQDNIIINLMFFAFIFRDI
jgi:hypothetical protein